MKNCFDRTPHTMKDWLLLAAGVAAVFAAADWLPRSSRSNAPKTANFSRSCASHWANR